MVFFTCSACGASLKKNQVDKHCSTKCRHCEYVTCIDCLKDFPGDTYRTHTKCMTENERYGGLNYVPKVNKNENRQLKWVENIQNLLEESSSLDPDIRELLQSIIHNENIPRKRAKFINFIKNINKRVHPKTVEKTWEFFEKALKQNHPPKEEDEKKEEAKKENKPLKKVEESVEDEEVSKSDKKKKKKKSSKKELEKEEEDTAQQSQFIEAFKGTAFHENASKKRKHVEEEDVTFSSSQPAKVGKFDWEGTITALLEKKDGSLSLKKLKKKILAEYESQVGVTHKTQEDLLSKMNKKLNKNKKFKIQKDQVILVS